MKWNFANLWATWAKKEEEKKATAYFISSDKAPKRD